MPARPVARRLEWTDPEALFLGGPAGEEHAFWLDAGPDATSGWSWLGVGDPAPAWPRDLVISAPDAQTAGDVVPGGFAGGWVGWLGYDEGARRAGAPAATDDAAPGEVALAVRRLVAFDHAARQSWLIAPEGDHEGPAGAAAEVARWRAAEGERGAGAEAEAQTEAHLASKNRGPAARVIARHTPAEYADLIARCREAIRRGDAYQLCLTTRFEVEASDAPIDPVGAYLRLRRAQPAHHGGYVRAGAHALLSASPEQFLQVTDGVVRTRPIKGTRPRGHDPAHDAALARELLESPKERAENVMIVDLMRNDLQRVCRPGTVTVEGLLEIESYPAVHQLVSTVAGRLVPGATLGELLDATFPAGSMTGAPKLSAMTILHGLEGAPRGVYAGCFGWAGHDGRADLAMTIRSIVVHSSGAYVGAGGGITWLSEPADEVAEVAVKARGPLAAIGATLPAGW